MSRVILLQKFYFSYLDNDIEYSRQYQPLPCIVAHLNNEGTVFDIGGCHLPDKQFLIMQSRLHHPSVL